MLVGLRLTKDKWPTKLRQAGMDKFTIFSTCVSLLIVLIRCSICMCGLSVKLNLIQLNLPMCLLFNECNLGFIEKSEERNAVGRHIQ